MDYQVSLQQYVMEINNQLADLQTLNPTILVQKLQNIVNSGLEQYIIQTIRTCIQHYQKDRAIIKYAYLVDKLLKLPVWNQIVQNVIVQFFCDIFYFLLIQKCFNQIDELKILRKFWLKTIHPRHLQAMRDVIFGQTGIDIDQYFKPDVIVALRSHYQKKLKLTPEQMNFHLPKTLKSSNLVYETKTIKTQQQNKFIDNASYLISPQPPIPVITPNINPNIIRRSVSPQPLHQVPTSHYRNPYVQAPPPQYYQKPQMMDNQPFRMKANIPQRISPPVDPRDPRMIAQKGFPVPQKIVRQQQNIPFYPDKIEFINENFKRERLYSEETRTTNPDYMVNQPGTQTQSQGYQKLNYETQPQPQKKIHYSQGYQILEKIQQRPAQKEPQKPKYLRILEMLRNDKLYKCKQCGKGYKSSVLYERHLSDHFEEKMEARQKKKPIHLLLSLDEWTEVQPLQFNCKLCNQPFDLKFLQDQWVLNNATFCDVDGQKLPLHKACQEALEDSPEDL